MARIFIDGFESGDIGNWTSTWGYSTHTHSIVAPLSGMTGSYCLKIPSSMGASTIYKNFPPVNQLFASFRCSLNYWVWNPRVFYIEKVGVGTLIRIDMDSNGTLYVYRGN